MNYEIIKMFITVRIIAMFTDTNLALNQKEGQIAEHNRLL